MTKQIIGMFDPFDENGDFDAEKIIECIKETVKEEEINNSDNDND